MHSLVASFFAPLARREWEPAPRVASGLTRRPRTNSSRRPTRTRMACCRSTNCAKPRQPTARRQKRLGGESVSWTQSKSTTATATTSWIPRNGRKPLSSSPRRPRQTKRCRPPSGSIKVLRGTRRTTGSSATTRFAGLCLIPRRTPRPPRPAPSLWTASTAQPRRARWAAIGSDSTCDGIQRRASLDGKARRGRATLSTGRGRSST